MQNRHYPLIAVFTILQLIVLLIFGYTPYPDSEGYITLASDALSHQQPYPVTSKLNEYAFLWNIGAINLVELSLWLFHSVAPLLVVYSLMKGATAWFLYDITKSLASQRVAMIALCLYGLYPANYGESTSVHSELPFLFFAMLAVYLCVCHKKYFFAGLVLAFANWIRPMGLVFLIPLLIYSYRNWHKNVQLIAAYILIIVIIGTATYHRTGLFLYQAKTGWMALTDYSTDHSGASVAIRERTDWNVAQKDSAWQSLFLQWLAGHPVQYIAQMPRKLANTYVSDNINMCTFILDKNEVPYMYREVSMPTLANDFPRLSIVQWLTVLNLLIYYALLATALASLRYFDRRTSLLPIGIIITGTLLLLFAGHGEARFHIPLIPFIIILSAYFLQRQKQRNRLHPC